MFYFLSLIAIQAIAEVEGQKMEPVADSSQGVILEFDHNHKDREQTENQKIESGQTGGIDMIVGGQSEDGIAKRKQLQVID